MASEVEICNRALQKLGQPIITSLTENSVAARACNTAFIPVKLAELRKHNWSCAIKRVQLAADTDEPIFGKDYSYTLPADFLRLLPRDPEDNLNDRDWQIEENRKLITNEAAPFNMRYIKNITDPNEMDPLFREALSSKLALEICYAVTQSNTLKESLREDYKDAIREAKRTNGIERVPQESSEDSFITARR